MIRIACVVEGHGEVESLPILVRRIASEVDPYLSVEIRRPYRVPRDRIVKQGELERVVEFSGIAVEGQGGILVLLDSDDDCPAELGPQLLDRARAVRADLPVAVILAKMEYEAWFLAAAESLDLTPPPLPEQVRDAKGWLARNVPNGGYSETIDQPALTARFDLQAARAADSFDKCYRDIRSLISSLTTVAST